ncbi:MAG TPA: hypothetical protein VN026_09815 [Bacteroidia bacterium]|nr:hypothetical protein [Bacteroidia bacterium]
MIHHQNYLHIRIYLFISFFIIFQQNRSLAQIVIEEEPNRLYYDFTSKRITKFKDMKNFRDVFHLDKYWLGKNRISGTIAYNTGRVLVTPSNSFESSEQWRQAISISTRIRFWEQFSFNTNFFIDFNKKATARWTSDYSYTIGRYNWKPNKFNYGYENYLNNKYSDDLPTFGEKFLEGYYFLSYSHNLPTKINDAISFDESTNLKFVYFVRYAIKYRDELNFTHGGIANGKTTLGFALRYTIYKNIYVEGAVYYYPEQFKRQAWDPDYTYGFGYFDWRSFRISITYGNWAINRFPGQENPYPKYGFLDGQFRVVANWIW